MLLEFPKMKPLYFCSALSRAILKPTGEGLQHFWYNYSAEQLWTADSEYCQCCVNVSFETKEKFAKKKRKGT